MAVWTRPKGSAVMGASLSGDDRDQWPAVSNDIVNGGHDPRDELGDNHTTHGTQWYAPH
jgi:hypothetical protein